MENSETDKQQNLKLEDRMKLYETEYNLAIPTDHCYCIRLDGHKFSTFTRGLDKLYDINLSKAMVFATASAVKEFSARAGYTQSDEITLVFEQPITENGQTHLYSGRVQKLVSLTASYVSIKFNFYLKKFIEKFVFDNPEQKIYNNRTLNKIIRNSAYFDGRILSFTRENRYELLNHLLWRTQDCYRNCIQKYAYFLYGPQKVLNMNCKDMIKLIEEKNIKWDNVPQSDKTSPDESPISRTVPDWQKYGVFIKKELILNQGQDGLTPRSRMFAFSFKLFYADDVVDFFMNHYYHANDNINATEFPYFDEFNEFN